MTSAARGSRSNPEEPESPLARREPGSESRRRSPVDTSRTDPFRVIICRVYPYMACPGCGSATPILHGRCTVCGMPAPPDAPTFAGDGLTQLPGSPALTAALGDAVTGAASGDPG